MEENEKIHVHLVSVWRESNSFFSVGGKEGMLFLTDKHLLFLRRTERMKNWWKATATRQVVTLHHNNNVMITHDGTTPYLSMFGTASSETTDLATITVVKSGDDIQLKGSISTYDDHVVKFVRRVIAV